jgi:hypothetical protein
VVESRLPKPLVAGSIPVSRSRFQHFCSVPDRSVHTVQSTVQMGTKTVNRGAIFVLGEAYQALESNQLASKRFSLLEIARSPLPSWMSRVRSPSPAPSIHKFTV